MSIEITRELVLRKLATSFPNPLAAKQALGSLDAYGQGEDQPSREGVQLAILKLSDGNLLRLRELVRAAKDDFRDVLHLAQAPEQFRSSGATRYWGELPARKQPSTTKLAAMRKRDFDQWISWLEAT